MNVDPGNDGFHPCAESLRLVDGTRGPIERLSGRVSLHGVGERVGFGGFIIWIAYATLTLLTAKTARA